jgi:hypothetical protein
MTCQHDWVVTGIAEIDDALMETQGHIGLTCAKCSAIARLERPTYFECYLVTKGWLRGDNPGFVGDYDDRLVIVLEGARADDLLTAGDDDQIDALGTMGWLETAADDWQAHEFDHLAEHAPTECNHIWFVTATYDDAGQAMAELQCTRCHEYARVSLTDDECETMAKGWEMGLCYEWDRNRHRVMMDRDEPRRPAVADLVNGLNLFEGDDDDDIPF